MKVQPKRLLAPTQKAAPRRRNLSSPVAALIVLALFVVTLPSSTLFRRDVPSIPRAGAVVPRTTVIVPAQAPQSGVSTVETGCIHTVVAGDNVFRIAKRYGVSQDWLTSRNGISNPRLIHVGSRLIVCEEQ